MAKNEKLKVCNKHSSKGNKVIVQYSFKTCPFCDLEILLDKKNGRIAELNRSVYDCCPDCDGPFTPTFTED